MQNATPLLSFDGKAEEEAATKISITAARISIAAVVIYQVLLVALIFVRPDLDPYWHTISEWAIGPYGWIMTLAFLISALSYGLIISNRQIANTRWLGKDRTRHPRYLFCRHGWCRPFYDRPVGYSSRCAVNYRVDPCDIRR